jgi:PTS system fructose-specific IIC component
MAAVMAAGMVPPLAAGAAALLRPMRTSGQERAQGRTALVLGAGFVTEGAIPLVATDPLRVMPSVLLGSGVSGALAMLLGAGVPTPHGGIAVITLIANPAGFVIALTAGTAVAATLIIALRPSGANHRPRQHAPLSLPFSRRRRAR